MKTLIGRAVMALVVGTPMINVCLAEATSSPTPLIQPSSSWEMNEYCRQKKIGGKDFYLAAQGTWSYCGKDYKALKSLGLDRMITPGQINVSLFDPSAERTEDQKRLVELYLRNQWPFSSNGYHAQHENAKPVTAEALKAAGDMWLGDGHTEYNYRFEFFLPPVRNEKSTWSPDEGAWAYRRKYYQQHGTPMLEKELPFFKDENHKWTRAEYSTLGRIQQEVTFREIGARNAIAWNLMDSNNGFSYLASLEGNRTVGEKIHTYLDGALCRGAMRQFGGNKYWMLYGPNEPTALLSSHCNTANIQHENGYPYSHCRIFVYQPYLAGINYYLNEGFAGTLYYDAENDGNYELSPLGHLVKEMVDFTQRHPDRGMAYTPVALMLDWERTTPDERFGTTYGTYLPMDDADQMNFGMLSELFFPQTPEGGGNSYLQTAPFGDLFDIIKPNVPGKGVDPKALENYKVLFALGGQTVDHDLASKVEEYVKKGGTFVVNVEDVGKELSVDFLGVELSPETIEATESVCAVCKKKFTEPVFTARRMALRGGGNAVVTTNDGLPIVSKSPYGKGTVIVVAAHYMSAKKGKLKSGMLRKCEIKPLLNFSADFMGHLCAGLSPVDVIIPEGSRGDLGYSIAKKGNGWLVTLINFSYEKEPVRLVKYATASVDAICFPKKVPVKIVCRFPVADALEWMEDRDMIMKSEGGATVIETVVESGGIKVIEMQPEKIELKPVERYVNYALNRPVQTSSETKGHEGKCLVDGNWDRLNGWGSASAQPDRRSVKLPASATIDLEEVRMIDHVETLFYYWQRERLEKYTVPWYTQFYVETSLDGNNWEVVFDERKNMKCNMGYPLERWFEPKNARYLRLTVTYDSLNRGAMVNELKVMGAEKETYVPQRISAIPSWEVQYPQSIRDVPAEKTTYLADLTPAVTPVLGWMPAGANWADLNGTVKLMTTPKQDGREYTKALYAEAPSEIVYQLPPGYATFAAAAGLGSDRIDDAVIFKVFVDGKEKFKSPLYRLGQPVLPVVVDIEGAKELKLMIEDPNGRISAYSWWGEARLIRK